MRRVQSSRGEVARSADADTPPSRQHIASALAHHPTVPCGRASVQLLLRMCAGAHRGCRRLGTAWPTWASPCVHAALVCLDMYVLHVCLLADLRARTARFSIAVVATLRRGDGGPNLAPWTGCGQLWCQRHPVLQATRFKIKTADARRRALTTETMWAHATRRRMVEVALFSNGLGRGQTYPGPLETCASGASETDITLSGLPLAPRGCGPTLPAMLEVALFSSGTGQQNAKQKSSAQVAGD